ncbi:hypothetical protein M5689_015355 [Euphorbia peplus]|nr:hypothetical protein M5689_015355 [Euphorbia peplus]
MRIRKRQVPLPLSSLSPVPLPSDPGCLSPVVVQLPILPEEDDTAEYFNAPDHPSHPIQKDILMKDEQEGDNIRVNFSGAKTDTSHPAGRWCEGEGAFPLKKMKMKTKMENCVQENGDKDYQEDDEKIVVKSVKKRGRGGALMEGSRCSRVNGRGWRCCQQTLVGYSLCEHHLGKGRLRSMTSVRSRSVATNASSIRSLSEDKEEKKHNWSKLEEGDNPRGEDDKPLLLKRKTKLGIVKARSMSSLLGQENNVISVAENNS